MKAILPVEGEVHGREMDFSGDYKLSVIYLRVSVVRVKNGF